MSTPTATLEPEFRADPRGGYAVLLGGAVIGYVAKCERNPAVWEAYTDADRTRLRGQRSTRARAAKALMLRPTRDMEIPDEALELLARAILGGRPILSPADHYRVHDVVLLPSRLTAAHTLRLAAYDVHDTYPRFAAWLDQRADEIDGGELR
jgi:hypothetical protein